MSDLCGAPKVHNSDSLHCVLEAGHDKGDDATWHQAKVREHRVLDLGSATYEIDTNETVTWEPLIDALTRAARLVKRVPS